MKAMRMRWLTASALTTYSAILTRFVVFKAIPDVHIGHLRLRSAHPHTGPANLVPFKTIGPELLGHGNRFVNAVNLIGNFVPFLPIGLIAPHVFRSISWQRALVLGVGVGLTFEVMEVIFRVGIFDVDDVILNAFGVIVGYGISVIFKRGETSSR